MKTGKIDERRWMKMTHWHGTVSHFCCYFFRKLPKRCCQALLTAFLKKTSALLPKERYTWSFSPLLHYPIPSMYGIFPYISHQNQPFMQVNIQSSHGWCGYGHIPLPLAKFPTCKLRFQSQMWAKSQPNWRTTGVLNCQRKIDLKNTQNLARAKDWGQWLVKFQWFWCQFQFGYRNT